MVSLTEGTYKEKGSKFIGLATACYSEQEAKEFLETWRKEHYQSRHLCYAYRFGVDQKVFRANDDGEPNNSAGAPILGQIQSFDLSNILIGVVRYFGGTLLGVGGLIQAYKNSAAEVLKESKTIEKFIEFHYTIQFPFEQLNDVMKLLKQLDCKISAQQFDTDCEISFSVRKANSEQCELKLKKIEGLILEYK